MADDRPGRDGHVGTDRSMPVTPGRGRGLGPFVTAIEYERADGLVAVASYVIPSTGAIWSVELSNLGTFVGALCFLAGALLLLPERTAAADPS